STTTPMASGSGAIRPPRRRCRTGPSHGGRPSSPISASRISGSKTYGVAPVPGPEPMIVRQAPRLRARPTARDPHRAGHRVVRRRLRGAFAAFPLLAAPLLGGAASAPAGSEFGGDGNEVLREGTLARAQARRYVALPHIVCTVGVQV